VHADAGRATNEDVADGWDLEVSRITPRLECNPTTRWAGPDLGQHTEEILEESLGLSGDDIAQLRAEGIVG